MDKYVCSGTSAFKVHPLPHAMRRQITTYGHCTKYKPQSRTIWPTSFTNFLMQQVLQPVAQLYGQVRMFWNQHIIKDSHWTWTILLLGMNCYKVRTAFLCITWLNSHASHWMSFSVNLCVRIYDAGFCRSHFHVLPQNCNPYQFYTLHCLWRKSC